MKTELNIKTKSRTYWILIILSLLLIFYQYVSSTETVGATVFGKVGIIECSVILYAFYKIIFRNGEIIFTPDEFKVNGYNWNSWGNLYSVYPFVEANLENGQREYIRFRLRDGSDLSIRSENLEFSFEEISELVNRYKEDYYINS